MPKKSQLFKISPDIQIIQFILEAFGLDSLEDTRLFTRDHMKDIDTVNKIIKLNDKFKDYYIPCKSLKYLININNNLSIEQKEKKCITILRQFIKYHNYNCVGREKSINGKKTMIYRLLYSNEDYLSSPINNDTKEFELSFE